MSKLKKTRKSTNKLQCPTSTACNNIIMTIYCQHLAKVRNTYCHLKKKMYVSDYSGNHSVSLFCWCLCSVSVSVLSVSLFCMCLCSVGVSVLSVSLFCRCLCSVAILCICFGLGLIITIAWIFLSQIYLPISYPTFKIFFNTYTARPVCWREWISWQSSWLCFANEDQVEEVHVSCRHARDLSGLCGIDKSGCSDSR